MIDNKTIDLIRTNIDNYLTPLVDTENFSGSILASVKSNKIISKGYGMANYELDVPNTSKTKFRLGSLTKQFTALAIMQLHEAGLLELDDTLDKFISDYPNGYKITIHHLLTHTSGIFSYNNAENFVATIIKKNYSLEKFIEDEIQYKPCNFYPGTNYSYTDSGYIILGYIIEKLSMKSYTDFLQENIFDKLCMNDSGHDDHYKLIKNKASGYEVLTASKNLINYDFIDISISLGAGSLYSTVEDLYLWNTALMSNKLISAKSLNNICHKHIQVEPNDYYGYGLHITDCKIHGKLKQKIWHKGGRPGFRSYNEIFLDDDVQIIMLSNVFNGYLSNYIEQIENIIFDHL